MNRMSSFLGVPASVFGVAHAGAATMQALLADGYAN